MFLQNYEIWLKHFDWSKWKNVYFIHLIVKTVFVVSAINTNSEYFKSEHKNSFASVISNMRARLGEWKPKRWHRTRLFFHFIIKLSQQRVNGMHGKL